MRNRLRPLILLLVLGLLAGVVAACSGGSSSEPAAGAGATTESGGAETEGTEAATEEAPPAPAPSGPAEGEYPRNETLYTSGTQWGPPSSWNPLQSCCYATGTFGLVYEPLFRYDPLQDEYTPWLAESGDWTSDNVYELKLRQGVTWSDGQPLTVDDVVFTFDVAKIPGDPNSTVWNWLESVEAVDDSTVRFTFSEPLYQEWANILYTRPVLPKHLWEGRSDEEMITGANENPVGTGPYLYETSDQDRMVWVRNDNWWAQDQLGLEVKPKYIVDIVNGSNNVALGLVLQGGLDLSNNFLPGINTLVDGGYGVQTYFPDAPYMLSANTAWLVPNTTKPPLDDPQFRRAIAYAVDVSKIVNGVYGQIVQVANPTGLLPNWDKYIDQAAVGELGFSYDPDQARQILADAGYRDSDGDGFVEMPDGSPIELSLIVPNGWTDWMEAIRVISQSLQDAGINVKPEFPDYNALVEARNSGNFDLLINNEEQISNTPWSYYDYLFRLPVQDVQATDNFARYENQDAWELTQQLDQTPVDDVEGMTEIISQLQGFFLEDLPVIPLWYNGMWAQFNNSVWTNWPSAAEDANQYVPSTWRGYWNMTGLDMLTALEPAPPPE